MLLGITAFGESFRAVGERVPDLFSSFVKHSQYLSYQRKLIFWYSMLCSDNPILYALSRLHQNRFIAIGCKYGIDLLTNSYVCVCVCVLKKVCCES